MAWVKTGETQAFSDTFNVKLGLLIYDTSCSVTSVKTGETPALSDAFNVKLGLLVCDTSCSVT